MLQDVRLQCISEVLKVITREFGIDSLVHELKPDEGKKTLISLIYISNDLFLLISKILSKKLNNFCNSASQCKYCGVMMINSTYIPRTYVRRASWNEMVRNVISCRKLLLHTTPPTLFMLQWAKREMLYSTLLRLKSMFDHMGKIITKGHRTSFNSKIVIILIVPFKQNMN